jgi:HSP20 family molecular chaperone IbpA
MYGMYFDDLFYDSGSRSFGAASVLARNPVYYRDVNAAGETVITIELPGKSKKDVTNLRLTGSSGGGNLEFDIGKRSYSLPVSLTAVVAKSAKMENGELVVTLAPVQKPSTGIEIQ